jgi:hypothetical protein
MYRKLLLIAAVMLMLIIPASADVVPIPVPDAVNLFTGNPGDNMTPYLTQGTWIGNGTDTISWSNGEGSCWTNYFYSSSTGLPGSWTMFKATSYSSSGFASVTNNNYYTMAPAVNCGQNAHYLYYKSIVPPAWAMTANATFSISETGNFTKKLSGAVITLSNGQTNTTGADGTAFIAIKPISPSYTYGVTKSGYMNLAGVALGGYGETGGIVYTNMDPAVGASKMVNLVAMQGGTDNYINGFTANVKDGSDNYWTNSTYPGGVAEIWTNKSTTLTGYISATGYDSVTQTFTTDNTDWAEDWVILMYPPTAANATVSNLRINVADYSTKLPLKGVNALLTSTGELGLTSTSGVASFTVPNGTSQQVIFSKSGYKPVTQSFTITTLISEWSIEMVEQTVTTVPPTPVHTYPNGSVIPATATVTPVLTGAALTAYNQAQDQAMMQQLRDAGPGLIQLCILVIIMALLGMLLPKMGK